MTFIKEIEKQRRNKKITDDIVLSRNSNNNTKSGLIFNKEMDFIEIEKILTNKIK